MSKKREYDKEYKVHAVKFAKNIGSAKAAAEELQIPVNTWIQKVKTAELDIGCGEYSPEEALSIAKENQQLKKRIKALEKENLRFSQIDIASGLKNSRSIFLQYTINTVICQVSPTVSLLEWSVAEWKCSVLRRCVINDFQIVGKRFLVFCTNIFQRVSYLWIKLPCDLLNLLRESHMQPAS